MDERKNLSRSQSGDPILRDWRPAKAVGKLQNCLQNCF
jgi:hypothetical protein